MSLFLHPRPRHARAEVAAISVAVPGAVKGAARPTPWRVDGAGRGDILSRVGDIAL